MENQMNVDDQNTQQIGQNPVSQPVQIPEKPKINYLVMSLVILICFVLFGFGGYYLGNQSSVIKQNTSLNQSQSRPTPTIAIDPMANWKAYTDPNNQFTFKYPNNIEPTVLDGSVTVSGKTYQTKQLTMQDSTNNSDVAVRIIYGWQDPSIDPYNISKYIKSTINSNWYTAYTENTINEPGCFSAYAHIPTFDQKNMIEIGVSETCPSDLSAKKSLIELDQILSTFKFTTMTSPALQKQQNNNWRTYSGKTFSFQYPNSWPDAITQQLSTRTEVVIEGTLIIDDGQYYDQNLGRAATYQEYINKYVHSNVTTSPYVLGELKGIRYTDEDNAGRTVVNIILSDALDSKRIFSLIYLSNTDVSTANTVLDPILATFKFKN